MSRRTIRNIGASSLGPMAWQSFRAPRINSTGEPPGLSRWASAFLYRGGFFTPPGKIATPGALPVVSGTPQESHCAVAEGRDPPAIYHYALTARNIATPAAWPNFIRCKFSPLPRRNSQSAIEYRQ